MGRYLFIGGDKRQLYAAEAFTEHGDNVQFAENSPDLEKQISWADSIVLPLPVTRDSVYINSPVSSAPVKLEKVIEALHEGQKVFAGMVNADLSEKLLSKGVKLYDYYKDEALIAANTTSTAEGVIHEAIGALEIDLCGAKTAVTGYGRTGGAIARRLHLLGADVTVAARSARDRACAISDGCKAIQLDTINNIADIIDLFINTIPAQIIGHETLGKLKKDCVVIEIASAPFGIDFLAAEQLGIKTIKAMSLPGKFSPKSAGKAIANTIIDFGRLGDK